MKVWLDTQIPNEDGKIMGLNSIHDEDDILWRYGEEILRQLEKMKAVKDAKDVGDLSWIFEKPPRLPKLMDLLQRSQM